MNGTTDNKRLSNQGQMKSVDFQAYVNGLEASEISESASVLTSCDAGDSFEVKIRSMTAEDLAYIGTMLRASTDD